MALTNDQSRVVREWKSSKSISLNAVCGSGKTHTLMQCAVVHKNSILLSYNTNAARQLQERINDAYAMHTASCYTYHALFSRLVQPCIDDDDVYDALAALKSGLQVPDEVRTCGALLIDEAQDIKPIYVEMLRCCGLLDGKRPVLLVGDPEQLIYDYDVLNMADDAYLLDPDKMIWAPHQEETRYTKFTHMVLTHTFRVPPIIAAFVNHVTVPMVPLISQGSASEQHLHVCTVNLYACTSTIASFLRLWGPGTVILTPTRNFNYALAGVINSLSAAGFTFHVHGLDMDKSTGTEAHSTSRTHVMTWHASKGLEFEAVIVFGTSSASRRKPLHVALTRVSKKMLIINDERKPCLHLLRGLQHVGTHPSVTVDASTSQMVTKLAADQSQCADDDGNGKSLWEETTAPCPRTEGIVSFERRAAACRWVDLKPLIAIEMTSIYNPNDASALCLPPDHPLTDNDFTVNFEGGADDVRDIYTLATAFYMEIRAIGSIGLVENMYEPAGWIRESEKMKLIRCGYNERWDIMKLQNKTKQAMISAYNELRRLALKTHQSLTSRVAELCCTLAVIANGSLRHYQHRTHHLLPVDAWIRMEILHALINIVQASTRTAIPEFYDKRLQHSAKNNTLMLVARCQYYSSSEKTATYLVANEQMTEKNVVQLASPALACDDVQRIIVINPTQNKCYFLKPNAPNHEDDELARLLMTNR
eukprot:6213998-Pleurochrysis_carterae.AAC.4